jgi:tRNA (guanine37-N1)-methyltransferase
MSESRREPLRINILTIFPGMFAGVFSSSILGRAQEQGLLEIRLTDIRPYSASKHHNTDDYPFGGGAGMVMMAQPIISAMKEAAALYPDARRIYLGPRGKKLNTPLARELAQEKELILLCGHYEGVDQRALDTCIDEEISIGDYILTGGETAAIVLVDCLSRFIPGVLGSTESPEEESFSDGLLEYPQYTRPRDLDGMTVPDVLLNGDHAKIREWRRRQSLAVTARLRPDLLETADLSDTDRKMLKEIEKEMSDSCSSGN